MKLYNSPNPAPNPRRVRIFLAEKGVSLPLVDLTLTRGEHKSEDHLARNSLGQTPTLELDDGRTLSESVAICRYLETLYPEPRMFGRDAFETASIEMWTRRVEFQLMTPVGQYWRHAHPFTAAVVKPQYKDFGLSNEAQYHRALSWLERELSDRAFLAGDAFTIADICAITTVEFAQWVGLETPAACERVQAWRERVSSRPSMAA